MSGLRAPSRLAAAFLLLASLASLGAGCGVSPSPPSLSGLELSPAEPIRPGEPVSIVVRFSDPDEDLIGGRAEIALRRETETSGERYEVPIEGESAPTGRLSFKVTLPVGAVPGRYELGVTVVDQAGRRSNALSAPFEVAPG